MNIRFISFFTVVAVGLVALHEFRRTREFAAIGQQNQDLQAELDSMQTRMAQAETRLGTLPDAVSAASTSFTENQNAALLQSVARIAALEAQIRALSATVGQFQTQAPNLIPRTSALPKSPDAPGNEAQAKRPWSPEQALGAPDTDRAGDINTAWASLDPDGGPEWLSLGFDHMTQIAEVRIRETFNPGAITKITSVTNGRETILWSGVEDQGDAPRDLSVPVKDGPNSQSIIIYLDTMLVRGWNEIDAVELIGRDGSHQWATSALASSTYADRTVRPVMPEMTRF